MSLQCNVTLSRSDYTAGQSPAPMATVTVYNPNASAVVVTSINMKAHALGSTANALSMSPSVPPTGPGMTVSVPTLSSITFGPFPLAIGSAANVNSFAAVNQSGNLNPINPQGSQPPQTQVMVGALVYGSDGSVNEAGEAGLLLSYSSSPPLGYQGGDLNFAGPNNFATGFLAGIF